MFFQEQTWKLRFLRSWKEWLNAINASSKMRHCGQCARHCGLKRGHHNAFRNVFFLLSRTLSWRFPICFRLPTLKDPWKGDWVLCHFTFLICFYFIFTSSVLSSIWLLFTDLLDESRLRYLLRLVYIFTLRLYASYVLGIWRDFPHLVWYTAF